MIHRKSFAIISSLDFFAIDVYLGIVFKTCKKFIILDDTLKAPTQNTNFNVYFLEIFISYGPLIRHTV